MTREGRSRYSCIMWRASRVELLDYCVSDEPSAIEESDETASFANVSASD